jgi:hypothetical protein
MKAAIKDHGLCTWVNPRYANHLFVYEKIGSPNWTLEIAADITKTRPSLKDNDKDDIVSADPAHISTFKNLTWPKKSNRDRYKYIKHGYNAVIIFLSFLFISFFIISIPLLPFILLSSKSTSCRSIVACLSRNHEISPAPSSGEVSQISTNTSPNLSESHKYTFTTKPRNSRNLLFEQRQGIEPATSGELEMQISSPGTLVTRKASSLSKNISHENANLPNQPL